MFGLKVKKKKKVNTDLVLANKGALGKAPKTNRNTILALFALRNIVIVPCSSD